MATSWRSAMTLGMGAIKGEVKGCHVKVNTLFYFISLKYTLYNAGGVRLYLLTRVDSGTGVRVGGDGTNVFIVPSE